MSEVKMMADEIEEMEVVDDELGVGLIVVWLVTMAR